ncbi:hypothetical protein Hanom_Chr12g01068541 [Helianthus anomalus]
MHKLRFVKQPLIQTMHVCTDNIKILIMWFRGKWSDSRWAIKLCVNLGKLLFHSAVFHDVYRLIIGNLQCPFKVAVSDSGLP